MVRMFFAAFTSASKIDPQLVQTKRERLMRLAASTARQALHVCEVWAGSTTTSVEPYHWHLYSSMVRIVRSEKSRRARFSFPRLLTSVPGGVGRAT